MTTFPPCPPAPEAPDFQDNALRRALRQQQAYARTEYDLMTGKTSRGHLRLVKTEGDDDAAGSE